MAGQTQEYDPRPRGRHVRDGVAVDAPGTARALLPSPTPLIGVTLLPAPEAIITPKPSPGWGALTPLANPPERLAVALPEPTHQIYLEPTETEEPAPEEAAQTPIPFAPELPAYPQLPVTAEPETDEPSAVLEDELPALPLQLPAPDVSMRSAVQAAPPPGVALGPKSQPKASWPGPILPPVPSSAPESQPASSWLSPALPTAPPAPVAPAAPVTSGGSLFDNIASLPRPALPMVPPAEPAETAPAPDVAYQQESSTADLPGWPALPQAPAWAGSEEVPDFTSRADADEPAFQSLPDVSTFRSAAPAPTLPAHPKPATARGVKEPMFVWRGKPIGAGADKNTPTPPKKKSAPAVQGEEVLNPQSWFSDTMQHALDVGASDLHLTLDGETRALTARLRIDGQMRPFKTISGNNASVIMGIFKTAAGFASDGSFAPEESLYSVNVDGEERKARVALFRTNNGGDALVLRLPPTGPLRALEDLEFSDSNLALFHQMLRASNRMILIAGPMGSGKTTTAHAALKLVSSPNRTVWSVEDPVERDLEGITQLEIDDKNGAGFDALLPSLVRADYDTLFLGEIRDKATASAGVRQAKAGRQIITTIHANNNVTAMLRLIELSEDSPLSVLDAVLGVVSQRLVRRLNPAWDHVDEATKYLGRIPIHEVLIVNDEVIEAVMRDKPLAEIKAVAATASQSTFEKDADRLVAAGITDAEEIGRVLGE